MSKWRSFKSNKGYLEKLRKLDILYKAQLYLTLSEIVVLKYTFSAVDEIHEEIVL